MFKTYSWGKYNKIPTGVARVARAVAAVVAVVAGGRLGRLDPARRGRARAPRRARGPAARVRVGAARCGAYLFVVFIIIIIIIITIIIVIMITLIIISIIIIIIELLSLLSVARHSGDPKELREAAYLARLATLEREGRELRGRAELLEAQGAAAGAATGAGRERVDALRSRLREVQAAAALAEERLQVAEAAAADAAAKAAAEAPGELGHVRCERDALEAGESGVADRGAAARRRCKELLSSGRRSLSELEACDAHCRRIEDRNRDLAAQIDSEMRQWTLTLQGCAESRREVAGLQRELLQVQECVAGLREDVKMLDAGLALEGETAEHRSRVADLQGRLDALVRGPGRGAEAARSASRAQRRTGTPPGPWR